MVKKEKSFLSLLMKAKKPTKPRMGTREREKRRVGLDGTVGDEEERMYRWLYQTLPSY